MKISILYVSLILAALGFQPLMAQEEPDFRGKIDELRKKKLLEELNLSKEKNEAFLKVYDTFIEQERSLHREKRDAFKKLVHMSALGEEIPDKNILKALDLINEVDMRIVTNHVNFVKDMGKSLTPAEIARVIVFEQNFQMKMREKVIDIRKKPKMKRYMVEPPPFIEEGLGD